MDLATIVGTAASGIAVLGACGVVVRWGLRHRPTPQVVVEHVAYDSFPEPFDFLLPKHPDEDLRETLRSPNVDVAKLRREVAELGGREVSFLAESQFSPAGLGTVTRLRFTLRGQGSEAAFLITSIRARIIQKSGPWDAAIIHTAPQGATMAEAVGFDLTGRDLDARTLTLGDRVAAVARAPKYLQGRELTLREGELLSFDVLAVVQEGSVQWVIDIEMANGSIITVNNNGQPFDTSARASAYDEAWTRNINSSFRLVYRTCAWPDSNPHVVS